MEPLIFHPAKRTVIAQAIGYWIFAFCISIFGFGLLGLMLFAVGFLPFLAWTYLALINQQYELREDGVFVKSGIISKKQSLYIFDKIQSVNETQTFIDKLFGLKTLQIVTMTSASIAGGFMMGLNSDNADVLKAAILERVEERETVSASKAAKISEARQPEVVEMPFKPQFQITAKAQTVMCAIATGIGILLFLALMFMLALSGTNKGQPGIAFIGVAFSLVIVDGLAGLIAFVMFFGAISSLIREISFKYFLASESVKIKSGLLATTEKTIPYEKILDIILSKSIMDIFLGQCSVRFETGESDYAQSSGGKQSARITFDFVPMLAQPDAISLRDRIFQMQGKKAMPNANPLVSANPLQKTKILKKSVNWPAILLVMLSSAAIMSVYNGNLLWRYEYLLVILGIPALVFALIYAYQSAYYKSYFYDAERDLLVIRKGVWLTNEIALPYDKIENVFVDQDLLDRYFGLYDVHCSTAGAQSDFEAHIDGVSAQDADAIREILRGKIKD